VIDTLESPLHDDIEAELAETGLLVYVRRYWPAVVAE
jgi:hypothetical protein